MKLFLLVYTLAPILILAAPHTEKKKINILNQCEHTLQVGYQTNDETKGHIVPVDQGKTYTLNVESNWAGRVWARESCDIHDCEIAGSENPASLAEFKLSSIGSDIDYYDVSFVDGFNFAVSIEPQMVEGIDELVKLDSRHCRKSECTKLPSCPLDLKTLNDAGKFIACESACSKYGLDEFCCTGPHNTADTCTTNHYANEIEKTCPDSYSYAFDDSTSVYGCRSNIYQVVFCAK